MVATPARNRLAHQPALDGLRAVAVGAVLLYHGGVTGAGGGFLGVDVFFALSGYLITSLLLVEWANEGRVSLRAFWSRRARRLLPALLLVVAAVVLYAAAAAGREELARIREDGLATLGYVANWRMVLGGDSYFEQFATPSPLRHAWSLGIEEQWYLVWPVVVAAALRLDRGRRRVLLAIIAVAAVASAAAMAFLAAGALDPSRAYYGTDTRAHGLLVGAGLAVVMQRWAHRRPSRAVAVSVQALGAAGLATIVAMVVVVHDSDRWLYRGGFGVVAIATCAVILAAVQPVGPVRRLLSVPALQAIGRVSYGLYLWHWPVYVFLTPSRVGLGGAALLAARLVATSVATLASYRLLERPVRDGTFRLPRPAFVAPAAAAAVAAALVIATAGVGAPRPVPVAAAADAPAPVPARLVPSAATPAPLRVLVVGDSVALTLAMSSTPDVIGDRAVVASEAILGCGVERVVRYAGPLAHEPAENCLTWPERWRAGMRRFRPDVTVLLIGAWEVFDVQLGGRRVPFGAPQHEALMRSELRLALDVLAAGDTRVVVLTTPCFDHHDQELFRRGSERNDPRRVRWVNALLADAVAARAGANGDARLVDLHALVCPDGEFRREIDGVRVRDDDGVHFHKDAGRWLWPVLLPQLEAAAPLSG